MTVGAFVFFVLFVAILFGMYIGIRRAIAPSSLLGAIGIGLGALTMFFFGIAQGNVLAQALLAGVAVGGGVGGLTFGIAVYFQRQENAPR